MLYRGSEIMREVAWVIFDEIHYMRDKGMTTKDEFTFLRNGWYSFCCFSIKKLWWKYLISYWQRQSCILQNEESFGKRQLSSFQTMYTMYFYLPRYPMLDNLLNGYVICTNRLVEKEKNTNFYCLLYMLQVHTSVVVLSVFKHTFLKKKLWIFFHWCFSLGVLLLTKSVFSQCQFFENF